MPFSLSSAESLEASLLRSSRRWQSNALPPMMVESSRKDQGPFSLSSADSLEAIASTFFSQMAEQSSTTQELKVLSKDLSGLSRLVLWTQLRFTSEMKNLSDFTPRMLKSSRKAFQALLA